MNPIGNDIVDVKAPGAAGKSGDVRFLRRVLGPDEQRAVAASENPDRLLWAFWAAKESAYKAISKTFPGIISSPLRYPVNLGLPDAAGVVNGTVQTPCGPVAVRIHLTKDHVHGIGMVQGSKNLDDVEWALAQIPAGEIGSRSISETESQIVRRLAGLGIAKLTGRPFEDIDIIRQKSPLGPGPPVIRCKGKPIDMDISLSHDGRFVAWALLSGLASIRGVQRHRIKIGTQGHPLAPLEGGIVKC